MMRRNILMLMANKTKVDPLDYLCFTAVSANSTIRLNKVGEPHDISLETSRDKKTWTAYNWTLVDDSDPSQGATGDVITLTDVGDKVYWRECTQDPDEKGLFSLADSNNSTNRFSFIIDGSVRYGGNILSLLDAKLTIQKIPAYAFKALFYASGVNLIGDVRIVANETENAAFAVTFGNTAIDSLSIEIPNPAYTYLFRTSRNNLNLKKVFIEALQRDGSAQAQAFQYCSNLSFVETNAVALPGGNSLTSWLDGVSPTGTFVCPAALPTANITRGASTIPENWTIKKKGYYDNGKFYDDAELTTESTLTEGEYYIDIQNNVEYYYDGTDLTPQN